MSRPATQNLDSVKGKYFVIEGQDGTGKDTQAELLKEYFVAQEKSVVLYSESGTNSDNEFVESIARLTYQSKQDIENRTRVLLYLINRYEQWKKLAEPALGSGGIVITTRNWLSTLIYEGYMGGASRSLIIKLHKEVMPERYFHPDKIVMLTLSEKDRAARRAAQGSRTTSELWKSRPPEFQQKLNATYLKVAKEYSIPTLSAAGTPEEVFSRLKTLCQL